MILDVRRGLRLGVPADEAVVTFPCQDPETGWPYRRLLLDGREVFALNQWCGTCPALFERRGAPTVAEIERLNRRLERSLDRIDDDVVAAYARLVEESDFSAVLLEVTPRLVHPGDADDYYTHEQVATWGMDELTGRPVDPGTAYYRTVDAPLADGAHLYEFVVPMAPAADESRVEAYADAAEGGTAVAVTLVDRLMPAVSHGDGAEHVVVVHFLLDGHHKVAAAAREDRPVRLLALVDERNGLAGAEGTDVLVAARG